MDEKHEEKMQRIATAAYELTTERGYAGCSMLKVARRAGVSNETLYKWFGDKNGLFSELVRRNAAGVKAQLDEALESGSAGLDTLADIGPVLLRLLLSERAILLNRAAASDASGELGQVLTRSGRQAIGPLLLRVLEAARERGQIQFDKPADALELYLSLLVGDLQIRRAIGQLKVPTERFNRDRSALALARLQRLLDAP